MIRWRNLAAAWQQAPGWSEKEWSAGEGGGGKAGDLGAGDHSGRIAWQAVMTDNNEKLAGLTTLAGATHLYPENHPISSS